MMISPSNAPQAVGPYSQAVVAAAGMTLFCSGQLPIDPATGQLVDSTIGAQVRQALGNMKSIIESAGFVLEDIVKTTIYCTDLARFPEINEVYESFFAGNFPARSTVEVKKLPGGAQVEIDAIACR
ncbi:MAG: YjgH/F family protein - putative translation initiation inhibitor [Deltaproteobacteria bacterium]|nr:YjgH/F family protein - putative translation initiation inhibitor [Deltaproteobacteria bacterium]